jgi:tetratricopeptide (TPR) repeat protein
MQDDIGPGMGSTASRTTAEIVAASTTGGAGIEGPGECAQASPASGRKNPLRDAGKVSMPAVEEGLSAGSRPRADHVRLLTNPSWQDFLSFVLSLGAVILIVVLIEPIAVPKNFSDDKSFGPDVASRRFQDAIEKVLAHINRPATSQRSLPSSSSGNKDADAFANPGQQTNIIQQSELPAIVLPSIGASLDSFAITIQTFLDLGQRVAISGEFTLFENHLGLVLRNNRHVIFSNVGGDPNHPEALLDQAAIRLLDEIEPTLGAMVHNNSGNDRHREGKPGEAEAEYRAAIALDPGNAKPHYNLANVLRDQGALEAATNEYRVAINLNPKDVAAHINFGNTLLDQGKFKDAIAEYQVVLTLDPKNADARSGLGLVYRDRGNLAEAIAEYRKAIELDPPNAAAHSNLGNVLREQGRYDEAIAEYRAALDLGPPTSAAYVGFGLILQDQGRYIEAIAEYRKAIELDPRNAAAYSNLGDVLMAQGKQDEAIAEYSKAIKLDPHYALPHSNLGNVLREHGRYDEAIAEYSKAIELDPQYALAHSNLGDVYSDRGNLAEAIAEYRIAIELDPKYPINYLKLGILLSEVGPMRRPEQTVELLTQARALIMKGAGLAPDDSDYLAVERRIDAKFGDHGRCPPQ